MSGPAEPKQRGRILEPSEVQIIVEEKADERRVSRIHKNTKVRGAAKTVTIKTPRLTLRSANSLTAANFAAEGLKKALGELLTSFAQLTLQDDDKNFERILEDVLKKALKDEALNEALADQEFLRELKITLGKDDVSKEDLKKFLKDNLRTAIKKNFAEFLEEESHTTAERDGFLDEMISFLSYAKLFSNPKTMEKFGFGPYRTEEHFERLRKRVDNWIQNWEDGDLGSLVIFYKDPNTGKKIAIGHIVANAELVKEEGLINIAIVIHDKHQGIGLGSEALSAMLHHAIPYLIQQLNLPYERIEATVRGDNFPSKAMLERAFGRKMGEEERKYGKEATAMDAKKAAEAEDEKNPAEETIQTTVTALYKQPRLVVEGRIEEFSFSKFQKQTTKTLAPSGQPKGASVIPQKQGHITGSQK